MDLKKIIEKIKSVSEFIPKEDTEKFVFNCLLVLWFFIILILLASRLLLTHRDVMRQKIVNIAEGAKDVLEKTDMGKYESVFNLIKYPEGIEEYTKVIKRDPFTERKKEETAKGAKSDKYDFAVTSIERIPLPLVYRGYIELEDTIIAQVNWNEETRFVKEGAILHDYKIIRIAKEKLLTEHINGEGIDFELNKPVLSNELEARLYDTISKKTFEVRASGQIGDYKVLQIAPKYVILQIEGVETKLEKK